MDLIFFARLLRALYFFIFVSPQARKMGFPTVFPLENHFFFGRAFGALSMLNTLVKAPLARRRREKIDLATILLYFRALFESVSGLNPPPKFYRVK